MPKLRLIEEHSDKCTCDCGAHSVAVTNEDIAALFRTASAGEIGELLNTIGEHTRDKVFERVVHYTDEDGKRVVAEFAGTPATTKDGTRKFSHKNENNIRMVLNILTEWLEDAKE
jgi:hypothetical protein